MFGRDELKAAITYEAIIAAAARERVDKVSVNSTLSLHIWHTISEKTVYTGNGKLICMKMLLITVVSG